MKPSESLESSRPGQGAMEGGSSSSRREREQGDPLKSALPILGAELTRKLQGQTGHGSSKPSPGGAREKEKGVADRRANLTR